MKTINPPPTIAGYIPPLSNCCQYYLLASINEYQFDITHVSNRIINVSQLYSVYVIKTKESEQIIRYHT